MGQIAYYYGKDKEKLYINIIGGYRCTNNCVFCNKPSLQSKIGSDLLLLCPPSPDKIQRAVREKAQIHLPAEFVFCGIGEPTIYLDTLLESLRRIKEDYPLLTRLNTNGQAYLINPGREVPKELKKAGLDTLSISLNAITAEDYDKLHRPLYPGSFESVLKFVRDSQDTGLETYVSFIEFELDKQSILKFVQSLNLRNLKLKFRELI